MNPLKRKKIYRRELMAKDTTAETVVEPVVEQAKEEAKAVEQAVVAETVIVQETENVETKVSTKKKKTV